MRIGAIVVACILLASPLTVDAQQGGKIPKIGFLAPATGIYIGSAAGVYEAFRRGLRDLGYVDGQNVILIYRSAPDQSRLGEPAAELVRLNVDVIVTAGVANFAAKASTETIPIVFASSGDPVEARLVESLARPGGNLTGISSLAFNLVPKHLELLKEAAPRISRVAVLANPGHPGEQLEWKAIQDAAQALGVTLHRFAARTGPEVDQAFDAIVKTGMNAILVFPDSFTLAHRARIADFAATRRLPSVFGWKEYAEAGGLLSYGPNLDALWKRIALFVDKILKGAKPGSLPVEQPSTFELVINLKTARTLGLTLPRSLLLRADRVIE
jgi:putative ABC transport system substrate-binding protein